MFGPSGFFQTYNDAEFPDSSIGLEVLYDSKAGFNILYRANKNGRFFVYKALKPEFRGNVFYEELMKKDFDIGFKLTHTAICQYYALVSIPEIGNCIVMEWIDGCSLESLLSSGRLSREKAKKLLCEICDGLEYMHKKQVIHRDLKPENILVTYNGFNAKIIDFGLSDADSYSSYKAPAGTRIYASPELLAGESIDGRSDIWSLGVIIREISGYYNHIADKCLKRDREKRFQNATEVKRAILAEGKRRFRILFSYSTVLFAALLIAAIMISYAGNDNNMQNGNLAGTVSETKGKTVPPAHPDTSGLHNSILKDTYGEEKQSSAVQQYLDKMNTAATDAGKQKESNSSPSGPANVDAESIEDMFKSAIKEL